MRSRSRAVLLGSLLLGSLGTASFSAAAPSESWMDEVLRRKLNILGVTVPAASRQQKQVDGLLHEMAVEQHGGVFDNGGLLKPGGVRELQALVREWERRGRRLWLVTVPAGQSPDAVAETIYTSLNLGERDVLIVLGPGRVYAKTLALDGERDTLARLAQESRRAFHAYRAKGLAEYASRIEARIAERRREEARRRSVALIGFPSGLAVGLIVFAATRRRRREAREQLYATRLQEATDILSEAALEYDLGASREQSDQVASLGARLEAARNATRRDDLTELDAICRDARALLDALRQTRAATSEAHHGDTETRSEAHGEETR